MYRNSRINSEKEQRVVRIVDCKCHGFNTNNLAIIGLTSLILSFGLYYIPNNDVNKEVISNNSVSDEVDFNASEKKRCITYYIAPEGYTLSGNIAYKINDNGEIVFVKAIKKSNVYYVSDNFTDNESAKKLGLIK